MKISFSELCDEYEQLRPYYQDNKFKFTNKSVGLLSKYTLKKYFNLNVEINNRNLCPVIPNRLRYLEILKLRLEQLDIEGVGLDVGCGFYAIYALIGHTIGLRINSIDIDAESVENSRKVLQDNGIEGLAVEVADKEQFFVENVDYTVCNPPFYESIDELSKVRSLKSELNRDAVSGLENELVTDGGELAFVSRMIDKSVEFKGIRLFSTLVNKYDNVTKLMSAVSKVSNNYWIDEFQLGKTTRWILFWSFHLKRPMIYKNKFKSVITVVRFKIELGLIEEKLKSLGIDFVRDGDQLVVSVLKDTWTRSAKRQKLNSHDSGSPSEFIVTGEFVYWKAGGSSELFQKFHTLVSKSIVSQPVADTLS